MTSLSGRPIVIADYDPEWPRRFRRECEAIFRTCGRSAFLRIEHVGSTAVPGLAAKPIVDMMPGVLSLADVPPLVATLASIGYEYVPEYEAELPERRYFRKDVGGERAFQLHVVEVGSDFWKRHLLFRDYLRAHDEAAAEYERLKRRLAAEYGADREGYTQAKTEFITGIEALARREQERLTAKAPGTRRTRRAGDQER